MEQYGEEVGGRMSRNKLGGGERTGVESLLRNTIFTVFPALDKERRKCFGSLFSDYWGRREINLFLFFFVLFLLQMRNPQINS